MDELSRTPRHRPTPGPADGPPGRTRRWVLAGGAAVVVGGGAGVAAEFLTKKAPRPAPRPAPALLVSAAREEQQLIADLDATTGGTTAVRRVLVQARADHAAHLAALQALLAGYDAVPGLTPSSAPASPRSGSASAAVTPRGTARTAAQLIAAEKQAAATASTRALASTGRLAALLASLSACESVHAALLDDAR